jgi:hypothetical protein
VLKSAPYYWIVCDGCGEDADYGDFTAFNDPGRAEDGVRDQDWTTDGTRHHCDACPDITACLDCKQPIPDRVEPGDDRCEPCYRRKYPDDDQLALLPAYSLRQRESL